MDVNNLSQIKEFPGSSQKKLPSVPRMCIRADESKRTKTGIILLKN